MPVIEAIKLKFQADASEIMAATNKATKSLSRFGTNAFFLGSRITAGIGLPIALLTKSVVGVGAAFDQAMTESLAIMDSKGQQFRRQMEDVAKSVALTTKFSAEEAAQAYFFLASSGMNAAESMRALPIAARFAQAGVIDLEKATELLSDAYITLGLRSSDPIENMNNMARVADVLTEANNQAQGTIIEFAQALTNRAGVAMRTFGIDVETGVAALAAFAERGIKGRTAGRQLFIVIRDLQRAVIKNKDAWTELVGPNAVFDMAQGKFKNIGTIIKTLEENLEGLGDRTKKSELQMLGFQERSLQATLALVGASDRIMELEDHLRAAAGVTQRVAEKQMMSFTNQMGLLQERLSQVGIALFDAFKPTIENHVVPAVLFLIKKLESLVSWIDSLSPRAKELIVNWMAMGVALGPVVAGIGALSLAMIPIIGVMGRVTAAFKLGTTALLAQGAAWKFIIGIKKRFHPGTGFRPFVATGNKVIFTIKTIVKSFVALLGPLGMLTSAVLIGWQAWKLWKSGSEGAEKQAQDLGEQVGITALRFKEIVEEYKKLSAQQELSEIQTTKLAHAEEMMAKALGTSVDHMRAELATGDTLLQLIERMSAARMADGEAAIDAARNRQQAMRDEIDLAKRRNEAIEESLRIGRASPFAVHGTEGVQAQRHFMTLSPQIEGQLNSAMRENLKLIGLRTQQAEDLDQEILQLIATTRELTDAEKDRLTQGQDTFDQTKDQMAQDQQRDLQLKAFHEKVDAMTAALAGQADEGLKVLEQGWHELSDEQKVNETVIKRLWERYSKLREHLDPSALPADLEAVTEGLRLEAEAMEFSSSVTGKFIKAMGGVDDNINELLANQGKIVQEFKKLNGVMDPRFFKSHGKVLEDLAEHYSDQLSPAMLEIIKLYEEWKKESKTTTDKIDEDQKKAVDSIVEASNRMAASMMDKQAELAAFSLSTQDAEIVGLKKGYHTMKFNHAKTIADMIADAATLPEAERQAMVMRIFHAKNASEQMLADEKRIGLLRTLKALGVSDEMLRDHREFSEEWLEQEADRIEKAIEELTEYQKRVVVLTSMGGLLSELATAIPALNSTAQAISGIASASESFGESKKAWETAENDFDRIQAAVSMATAAVAAFNAISQIKSRGGRAAAGGLAGAQMGAAFGPIGAAVGAGVGALAGLISKDPGWAKIQKSIGRMWQVSVSDELAKKIEETADEVGDDFGAMLLHINEVIEESGGVTERNVGKWTRKVRDAFSMIDQGVFTTAQAAEVLDENFAALAEAGTMLSGVLRKDVLELIQLDEKFRTNSEAIQEFKTAMVDQAVAGLTLFAEGVKLIREESGAFEQDFQQLGDMVEMAFAVMVEQGKPFVEILTELGPALDELILLTDSLGTEGSETLEMLLRFREFTKINEGLIKKIDGARMMMVGLTNAGYLSEQQFEKFGTTVEQQFNKLIERGLSSDDALILMLPTLMALSDAAALYGFEISENTQLLLNQAKEKGLMGEKAKTVDEQMLQAQMVMIDALGVMVELFGGKIPESMRVMQEAAQKTAGAIQSDFGTVAGNIQSEFNRLSLPKLSGRAAYRIDYDYGKFDPSWMQFPGLKDAIRFQHGGLINKPTLAMTGEGGEPELIGPVSFMTKALEGAMNQTGQGRQQEDILNEMRGLRKDMRLMPIHLRDAIILAN